jgi:RimJ/RimL family protein N-acetyltransferase
MNDGERICFEELKESVERCIVDPEPKNLIAIKAYENAGFRYLKTIQIPEEEEPEYLMEIKRRNHLIRPR